MKLPVLLVCWGVMSAGLVFAESQKVAAEKLPPAVWKTLQTQSGGKEPGSITRDETDGVVVYQAIFAEGTDQERNITVAEGGALMTMDVTLTETPVAVQKTINAQLGDGTLDGVEKDIEDGEVSYAVDFTTKGGQEKSLSVAEDGTLLSIEVGLEETPAAVQSTIKTQFADGKIGQIEKTYDDGVTTYEVDFTTKAGKEKTFTVASDGRLTSVEVSLDDLTPAAQKAVNKKIGSGRIVHLSQSIGDKQTITDYVVEGMIDGKAVAFKVGLKGKILANLD